MPVTRNARWPGNNHPALDKSAAGGKPAAGAPESWGGSGPEGQTADGDFLAQITWFQRRFGLSDLMFLRLLSATPDRHLLRRLRTGSWPRATTVARVRAAMAAYSKANCAKAGGR